jgi:hypothetical protein
MKIEKPGIYRGVESADYFSDPAPSPSLTQSLCKIILERSPQHAWFNHPRLNPQFEYDDDTKFDIGNVAHRLLLGRGKEIEVLKFPDWRTKAAQEAREKAADEGKIGVLIHQYDLAWSMASLARTQLDAHEDADAFRNGDAEVMIVWEEDGIWFRALIDWLHADLRTVDDFKTTGKSVAPHMLGLVAEAGGWDVQAAFIERGLNHLDNANAGRRQFRFIAQETDQPHALSVMHMSEHWLTMGRKKVEAAISIWKQAVKANRWSGYPARSITPDYPGFRENQWLSREIEMQSENDPDLIFAG